MFCILQVQNMEMFFSIDQFPDMFPDSLELYSTSFNHIEASPLHCTDIAVEGHGEKYPQHPSWGS